MNKVGQQRTKHRTTVTLPHDLVEGVHRVIREGRARSMNEVVAASLRDRLESMDRESIDAEFAGMAVDARYQELAARLCKEYEKSDWEALLAEDSYREDIRNDV